MTRKLHINGPALVTWNDEPIGYADASGVSVEYIGRFFDIMTDKCGWVQPENALMMGEEAKVSLTLVLYDDDNLQKIVAKNSDASQEVNQTIGTFMIPSRGSMSCKNSGQLTIQGINRKVKTDGVNKVCNDSEATGTYFYCAYLTDNFSKVVGTRVTKWKLIFRCMSDYRGRLQKLVDKLQAPQP